MIYSNFTGRVAKKAKLIDGVNGQFLSMDMAVNDYSKGEEVTQWVRVQSNDPAHLKLAEYFTKGRILTIQGISKIDQWEGKDGTPHAQLRVHAYASPLPRGFKCHVFDILIVIILIPAMGCYPNRGAKMRFSECQQTRLIGRA